MESLAGMKDLDEIIHELNSTIYKEDLTSLAVKYSGADLLEAAVNRHLVRSFRTVFFFTPDDSKDIMALILGRWDIRNINLIISSKALGHVIGSQSDVFLVSSHDYPLGPIAGSLSFYDLKNLIEMKDISAIVEWVSRKYGGDFTPYLEKYRTEGDIGALLLQIELAYLRRLVSAMQSRSGSDMRVLAAVKSRIDEKNIVAVLKGKQADIGIQDLGKVIVDGGNLSRQALTDLYRSSSVEEMVEGLKPFYDLSEALPEYRSSGLVALENLLNRRIASKAITSLRVAPPSLASIVAYVMLKELEVENLTKIIRGKENDVPDPIIRASLVFA
jgi:V/A-type H+-transporting ATPase subunit C